MDKLQTRIKELMEKQFSVGETAHILYNEGHSKQETDKAITDYINNIVKDTDTDEYI